MKVMGRVQILFLDSRKKGDKKRLMAPRGFDHAGLSIWLDLVYVQTLMLTFLAGAVKLNK